MANLSAISSTSHATIVSDDEAQTNRSLQALPTSTVRLLGSSQVITSVFSVVKELIENSLDARASSIDIKLEGFGLERIEVRDNGSGISQADMKHVAQRYHTSKISSFTDLQLLSTYGFRGEALGSLCSVSNLTITSKTAADEVGTTVTVDHEGQITSSKPSHFGKGTTVIATHLFKNLPVRRQFYNSVKKKKEELKRVEDLVMAYAVIRPDLRVSLRHGKDLIWQKFAVLDHRTVLLNIFGTATFNQLQHKLILQDDPKMKIESFIPTANSKLQLTSRASNDRHFTFVNGRPVLLKEIDKLVRHFYMSSHPGETNSGPRYPIYFLSIVLPPSDLDVNVEPNKTKVMLENQDVLLKLLSEMLEEHYGEVITPATAATESRKEENNNSSNTNLPGKTDLSSGSRSTTEILEEGDPLGDGYKSFCELTPSPSPDNKDGSNCNLSQDDAFGSFEIEVLTPQKSQASFDADQGTSSAKVSQKVTLIDSEQSKVDNSLKGSNYANAEPSQKQLAFQELLEDMNADDLLSTFDDDGPSNLFGENKGIDPSLSSELPKVSAQNWSKGTGLVDSEGKPLQGPAMLCSVIPSTKELEPEKRPLNGNGKRPSSPTEADAEAPHPKKQFVKTAETTMFDLISSQPIKRPQTAFIHFSKEVRPQVVEENPGATFQDIARITGQRWKELSQSDRKKYEDLTTRDVERYRQQVASSKEVPNKSKKRSEKVSKRLSLSIKDCLLSMMSPQPRRASRASLASPPPLRGKIKTVTAHMDMKRLKHLYAGGLTHSQTLSTPELKLIGCLKSHGSWVCRHDNRIEIINTFRIEETMLHQNLMKNHVLKPERLDTPVQITPSSVNTRLHPDLFATLVSMARKSSDLIGGQQHIADKRLVDNGFDITWTTDDDMADVNMQVVGMSAAIPGYGLSDLREIVEQINMTTAEVVSQCRPFKVINYLKSEAVRMMRKSPVKTQREEVEDLLDQSANQIPSGCVTCLHNRPFYNELYDLSNFSFSQTQSTQATTQSTQPSDL